MAGARWGMTRKFIILVELTLCEVFTAELELWAPLTVRRWDGRVCRREEMSPSYVAVTRKPISLMGLASCVFWIQML